MTYPVPNTLTVAGRVFTDLDNLKILSFAVGGANGYCTVREQNGTAGYTPSGSNKFRVLAIEYIVTVDDHLYLSQTSNDIGFTTPTPPTVTKEIAGAAEGSRIHYAGSTPATTKREIIINFLIDNGAFITILMPAGAGVFHGRVYGYEVP